MTASFIYLIQR